jgi:hypothetical protein
MAHWAETSAHLYYSSGSCRRRAWLTARLQHVVVKLDHCIHREGLNCLGDGYYPTLTAPAYAFQWSVGSAAIGTAATVDMYFTHTLIDVGSASPKYAIQPVLNY